MTSVALSTTGKKNQQESAWCSGRKSVSMPEQTHSFTCILSFSSLCPSEVTAIFFPAAAAFQENGCVRTS